MKAIILGSLVFGICMISSTSVSAHYTDTIEKVAIVKSNDFDTNLVVDIYAPAILTDIFVFEPLVAFEPTTKHSEPRKAVAVVERRRLFPLARDGLRRSDTMS